jgi:medium-chain acyl-[acyl-carrier-protein] hydrolase
MDNLQNIRLFCLPHAGGSASSFYSWRPLVNKNIEIYPIDYCGHGKRNQMPLKKNFKEAFEDILSIIIPLINEKPYAIFAHSLGVIYAYELGRTILKMNLKHPLHIFFSGRYPPYIEVNRLNFHKLSDAELLRYITLLTGLNETITNEPSIIEYIMPILRADVTIAETYVHKGEVAQFPWNISVFQGTDDPAVNMADHQHWDRCTAGQCKIYTFSGDHFFHQQNKKEIISTIESVLL